MSRLTSTLYNSHMIGNSTPLYPSLHNLVTFCFIYWLVDIAYFLIFQLILNSMHKYQPRVHIIRKRDHTASVINLKSEEMKTFTFPETNFIGVTAYQNQLVSQLRRSGSLNLTCFPSKQITLTIISYSAPFKKQTNEQQGSLWFNFN